jgi:hypothetical protein
MQTKARFILTIAFILVLASISTPVNQQFCESMIEGQTTTPSDPSYVHDTDEYFQLSDT